MKKQPATLYIVLFFFLFFVADIFRFQHVVFEQNGSTEIRLSIHLIAAFAGVLLFYGLYLLKLVGDKLIRALMMGAVIGTLVFSVLFVIEDTLSQFRLKRQNAIHYYERIEGHCGVYPGRVLVQVYHNLLSPSLRNQVQDFQMSNQCRLQHLKRYGFSAGELCSGGQVDCNLVLMRAFSARGYWNPEVRKVFLARVEKAAIEASPGDAFLIQYALLDHELEVSSPDYLAQAGVAEDVSDEYHINLEVQELESILVSKSVFDTVSMHLKEKASTEFLVAEKSLQFRVETIPEIKKRIEQIQSRI